MPFGKALPFPIINRNHQLDQRVLRFLCSTRFDKRQRLFSVESSQHLKRLSSLRIVFSKEAFYLVQHTFR